jgi:hypothetical protein
MALKQIVPRLYVRSWKPVWGENIHALYTSIAHLEECFIKGDGNKTSPPTGIDKTCLEPYY